MLLRKNRSELPTVERALVLGNQTAGSRDSVLARSVVFPILVTTGLVAVLLPLAIVQLNEQAPGIVVASSLTVVGIVLLTAVFQRCLSRFNSDPLKQLALVGGLRFGLSITAVLVAYMAMRDLSQPEVLLLAVPFYLGLLAAESTVMVVEIRKLFPR
jgi:hypothetical protein